MANNAGAIRAGRAFVELFTDANPMIRGLNQAAKKFKSWGSSLTSMGTKLAIGGFGAAAGIVAFVKSFADAGSALDDTSQRTGVAVEALSELQYAAEQSGAGLSDLEAGFRNLGKFITHAREGSKESTETLTALGITMAELAGKSPDQQMELIADRLAAISDPGIRASRAMEIFGKSGTMLLPMMSQGAAGLRSMRNEARELGLVMSKEDATAAAEMGDAFDRLWSAVGAVKNAVGSAFTADLKTAATWLIEVAKSAGKWIREHKGMVSVGLKVVAGVLAMGVALAAIGLTFTVVGSGITAMTAIFAVLAASVAYWPLLLATAAGAFLYFSGAGSAALKALAAMFPGLSTGLATLLGNTKQVLGAIAAAIGSGDIPKAWKIMATMLEVGWLTALDNIKHAWTKAGDWLMGAIETPIMAITQELAAFVRELQQMSGIDIGVEGLESLDQMFTDRKAARDKRSGNGFQSSAQTLDARERLSELLTPSSAGTPADGAKRPDLGGGFDADITTGLKSPSSMGTKGGFNAFALSRSFGTADPAKETAKNTKETAKHTKKTAEKIANLTPPTFGP